MDTVIVIIGLIISAIACIVSIIVAISNKSKSNQDGGYQLGKFEGTITAELKSLSRQIEKLDEKVTRNNAEIYEKIEHVMENHIKEYHGDAQRA